MRFPKQFFLLVLICVSIATIVAQEIPEAIIKAFRNAPEDCLVGIGMAKAETEWESLSLAMTRARTQIVRAVSSEVRDKLSFITSKTDLTVDNGAFQEDIIEVLSSAHLMDSRIVALTKASDSTWWCAIYMPKNPVTIIPQQIDFSDVFLYDLSRVSSINNLRVVFDINLWINHLLQRQSEDMVYGFGVARLETDTASFQLAKEQAINSIANSLHAEISSTVSYYFYSSEIDPDSFSEQFNESISVESEYDDADLPLGLVDYGKTEDGSLWVALGCKVISAPRLPVPVIPTFDAEARMDEYLWQY